MNPKTIINGKEYCFIKTVKELTTDRIAVLCEDEHGCSFICDAEMWQGSAEKHKTAFNKYASPNQKIKLFKFLFIGMRSSWRERGQVKRVIYTYVLAV